MDKQCHGSYVTEREKDAPRGDRTHTFCYPGRCPKTVRLEETSSSRLASICNISGANSYVEHAKILMRIDSRL